MPDAPSNGLPTFAVRRSRDKAPSKRHAREMRTDTNGNRVMPVGWLNDEGAGWMQRRAAEFPAGAARYARAHVAKQRDKS